MARGQDNPFIKGVEMTRLGCFLGAWLIGIIIISRFVMPTILTIPALPNLSVFLIIVVFAIWTIGCATVSLGK
jgi:hypothetical protein